MSNARCYLFWLLLVSNACFAPPELHTEESIELAQEEIAASEEAAAREPMDPDPARRLCHSYSVVGDLDASRSCYENILEEDPSDLAATAQLAYVLLRRGRYTEATQHYRSFLRLAENHLPDNPDAEEFYAWSQYFLELVEEVTPEDESVPVQEPWTEESKEVANSLGMEFVWIPGGTFLMGQDGWWGDARPAHEITVRGYWMGKYEVTVGQYARFLAETRYDRRFEGGGGAIRSNNRKSLTEDHPILAVSWNDARAFSIWLSLREGAVYRPPTEAEWEFAARGTDGRLHPWGNGAGQAGVHGNWGRFDEILDRLGPGGVDRPAVERVGSYPEGASFFGLLDMAGNVEEWCLDSYDPGYYDRAFPSNPFGPLPILGPGSRHVTRGGSWRSRSLGAFAIERDYAHQTQAYDVYGMRIVREAR